MLGAQDYHVRAPAGDLQKHAHARVFLIQVTLRCSSASNLNDRRLYRASKSPIEQCLGKCHLYLNSLTFVSAVAAGTSSSSLHFATPVTSLGACHGLHWPEVASTHCVQPDNYVRALHLPFRRSGKSRCSYSTPRSQFVIPSLFPLHVLNHLVCGACNTVSNAYSISTGVMYGLLRRLQALDIIPLYPVMRCVKSVIAREFSHL